MAIGYVIGGLLAQRLQRTADFSNIGENSVIAVVMAAPIPPNGLIKIKFNNK